MGGADAITITSRQACTPEIRLAGARQVIYAYNLREPGAAAEPFKAVPWGNKDNECITSMYVFLPFPAFLLIGNKQRR